MVFKCGRQHVVTVAPVFTAHETEQYLTWKKAGF